MSNAKRTSMPDAAKKQKRQYWAFLTHEDESSYLIPLAYTLRVSSKKHRDPRQACVECFGCVLPTWP